jgi:hypothetical protein
VLANAIFPLALSPDCGVKMTVRAALCPGASVSGRLKGVRVNPVPVVVAWDTVKLVPPVFVRVADWLWLLPTCTLPNVIVAGLAVRLPGLIPAPVTARVKFEFAALETSVTLPVTAPADVGANVT